MKKRCTNSSCRKIFSYEVGTIAVCPHCKKVYQRSIHLEDASVIIDNKKYSFSLIWNQEPICKFIASDYTMYKVLAIKHLRNLTGLRLKFAKEMADFIQAHKRLPVNVTILEESIKVTKSVPIEVIPKLEVYREAHEKEVKIIKRIQNMEIEELDLSVRGYNVLRRAGITHVQQLAGMTKEEMLSICNMGRKTYEELLRKLEEKHIMILDFDSGWRKIREKNL